MTPVSVQATALGAAVDHLITLSRESEYALIMMVATNNPKIRAEWEHTAALLKAAILARREELDQLISLFAPLA